MNPIDPRQELMTHVERIVRPIRATQSTKLRMRRELLAHLQSACDEGLNAGQDRAAAVSSAVARLGDPSELRQQLQRTVPLIQRLFLARVPSSRRFDEWEKRSSDRLWGMPNNLTMAHAAIIAFVATVLPYVACMTLTMRVKPSVYQAMLIDRGFPSLLCLLFLVIVNYWAFVVSARLIAASASVASVSRRRLVIKYGATIVVLVMVPMILSITMVQRRSVTAADIGYGVAGVVMSLAILMGTARLISILRRPFDEWLTIDVAN